MSAVTNALKRVVTTQLPPPIRDIKWVIYATPEVLDELAAVLGFESSGRNDVPTTQLPQAILSALEPNNQLTVIIHAPAWAEWVRTTVSQIRTQYPKTPILIYLEHCGIRDTAEVAITLSDQQAALVRLCTKEYILLALDDARLLVSNVAYYQIPSSS